MNTYTLDYTGTSFWRLTEMLYSCTEIEGLEPSKTEHNFITCNKNRIKGKLHLLQSNLEMPFSLEKPETIFVDHDSDLFHKAVPLDYIKKAFDVMNKTPQHNYYIHSKNAKRLEKLFFEIEWSSNIKVTIINGEFIQDKLEKLSSKPDVFHFAIGTIKHIFTTGRKPSAAPKLNL
jgi:protein gp37